MNESGQNFDELKKLLKLKRHEAPPPGFFNHFSDEIVARIRAGEGRGGGTFLDRLNDQAPWIVNFIRIFEARPGVIGGFATGLCLLLLLGVVLAEHSDTGSPMLVPAVASTDTASAAVAVASAGATPAQFASATLSSEGGIAMSTNSSLQPVASVFGQPNNAALFQPASFAPAR
jgi:hypothetical protein